MPQETRIYSVGFIISAMSHRARPCVISPFTSANILWLFIGTQASGDIKAPFYQWDYIYISPRIPPPAPSSSSSPFPLFHLIAQFSPSPSSSSSPEAFSSNISSASASGVSQRHAGDGGFVMLAYVSVGFFFFIFALLPLSSSSSFSLSNSLLPSQLLPSLVDIYVIISSYLFSCHTILHPGEYCLGVII